jgi:glutaredoxin
MKYRFLLLVLIAFAAGPVLAGQFYEYTDKSGNVNITDSPPLDAGAREKQVKEEGVYRSNRAEKDYTISESRETADGRSGRRGHQKRDYSRVSVVMYKAEWCGYCKKAREYIRSLGADLIEYDIDKDKSRRDELREKTGSTSIPLIDIEGTIIRGYNAVAIKAALDRSAK